MKKFSLKPAVKAVAETLHRVSFGYMQRMGLLYSAAHTAAESFTDSTYAISASLPATYNAAGYGATSVVYTIIGRVSKFPAVGREQAVNEFIPIAGAVEYIKGAPRYGTGDMEMADMPLDAGQVIVKAASESPNHYSMKETRPDGAVRYLDVIVASFKLSEASEGAIALCTATLGICKAPVIVAAV